MKRVPDILMILAIVSGVVYLLEYKATASTDRTIKWISIGFLIASLLGSIITYLADQHHKTKP